MLQGTGLYGGLSDTGVLTVSLGSSQAIHNQGEDMMNRKKNILASTIAFFVGAGGVSSGFAQELRDDDSGYLLEEVIVTANKRGSGQSLQDTAMSITAVTGETIEKRGFLELSDFAPALPGVSLIDVGAGDKRVFIRGLASLTDQNSLTSAYLGEMPLSTTELGAVDLRLVDIERIEVLKGPQGTLYGSSSLSGTLRYIPVAPNLDSTEGSIEVDFATFAESDDTSESFTGVFNTPLIEGVMGLRVAAYHFEDAGIVDYVSTPAFEAFAADTGNKVRVEEDVNSATTTGIRASFLWDISDELNVNLTLGMQDQQADGFTRTDDNLGANRMLELDNGRPVITNDTDYVGLVVGFDLGWAELTSSSSLLSTNRESYENFVTWGQHPGFSPIHAETAIDSDTVAQEFRLSSQLEGPIQFLAGLYYEDVEVEAMRNWQWQGVPFTDTLGAYGDPGTEYGFAATDGLVLDDFSTFDLQQHALFGELSYQLNEVLELTVGARHFDYEKSDMGVGSAAADRTFTGPPTEDSQNGQTYKANISFTPNDDTLIYALWSEGFRLGRTQTLPDASDCDVNNDGFLDHTGGRLVRELSSDLTENIELGAKFTLLDNRITLNATVYQMDWVDRPQVFQDTTDECRFSVFNNVGEVRSEGFELELAYLVTEALSVDLALGYNNTEFTKVSPNAGVEVGDEVEYAPHSQANLGLEYSFDVSAYPAFIRTDINYRGEAESYIQVGDSPRSGLFPTNGDYINVGLRVGINIDQWELALYGNNLLNEDAATFYDAGHTSGRVKPRKLGLNVKYAF